MRTRRKVIEDALDRGVCELQSLAVGDIAVVLVVAASGVHAKQEF